MLGVLTAAASSPGPPILFYVGAEFPDLLCCQPGPFKDLTGRPFGLTSHYSLLQALRTPDLEMTGDPAYSTLLFHFL